MINRNRKNLANLLLVFLFLALCIPSQAEITRVIVTKTEPYLDGKVFRDAGSYVRLSGQVYGEVDPLNPLNSLIQDISLAIKTKRNDPIESSDAIACSPIIQPALDGM